jgi:hypothetical protein
LLRNLYIYFITTGIAPCELEVDFLNLPTSLCAACDRVNGLHSSESYKINLFGTWAFDNMNKDSKHGRLIFFDLFLI